MLKRLLCGIFLICLLFAGCQRPPQKYTAYYFDYFDTATTIVGYADSKAEFDAVCADIAAELDEYHRLYTIYTLYDGVNNLCALNRADGAMQVDAKITDMLAFAREMYTLTHGKTNVAMGSVLSLWHDARTHGTRHPESASLPDMERLKAAAEHTDIEKVQVGADGTVTLADPAMSLDVGAVAKGYAIEQVARRMEAEGIAGYLLNVGGNIRSIGTRADGKPWSVGIENPSGSEEEPFIAYLSVAGESVVTSGAYQRFYVVNGESYHHIIDPETLLPAAYFLSVSVICRDSGLGDALSTALFCMPEAEGRALVESLENVEAMWVYPDGTRTYSAGFQNYCK